MYKLREVDKMLLLQSAAGFPRTCVFDQLVIEFHASDQAELLALAARWVARHQEWEVVAMNYRPRHEGEKLYSLALHVDPGD